MAKPAWAIPDPPAEGNLNPDEIYVEIGKALHQWENVEDALSVMFDELVGGSALAEEPSPAMRAYGAITGFRSRTDMLRAAAECYFHQRLRALKAQDEAEKTTIEELQNTTERLISEAQGWSARRNDVAHAMVVHSTDSRQVNDYVLVPPSYNSKKYDVDILAEPTYTYNAEQIRAFASQFRRIAHEVAALRFPPVPRPSQSEVIAEIERWLQSPLIPSQVDPRNGEKKL